MIKKALRFIVRKLYFRLGLSQNFTNDKEYKLLSGNRLDGRTVVVTGSTGAIGSAICSLCITQGAEVVLVGRNREKLEALQSSLNTLKESSSHILQLNLENYEESRIKLAEFLNTGSRIDAWVNCAGGSARDRHAHLAQQSKDVIDDILASNLRTSMIGSKLAAEVMLPQQYGRIINIGSSIALQGKAGFVDYAATKAAVVGYTRSLAMELGPSDITVNCVSPGFIQRGEFDEQKLQYLLKSNIMRKIGTAEDIAHAVVFLASDEAGFITGQNLIVDGGRSLGLQGD